MAQGTKRRCCQSETVKKSLRTLPKATLCKRREGEGCQEELGVRDCEKAKAGEGGRVQGDKKKIKAGTSNHMREDCRNQTLQKGGCV